MTHSFSIHIHDASRFRQERDLRLKTCVGTLENGPYSEFDINPDVYVTGEISQVTNMFCRKVGADTAEKFSCSEVGLREPWLISKHLPATKKRCGGRHGRSGIRRDVRSPHQADCSRKTSMAWLTIVPAKTFSVCVFVTLNGSSE